MFIHGDDPYDLGHTVAGWTGMAVATLGSGLCGLGLIMVSGPLLYVGVGVLALALLVTWSLHLGGWGKASGPRPAEQWDWRVRDTGAKAGHSDCLACRLAGRHNARRAYPAAGLEPARTTASRLTTSPPSD
ncbi:HGxxPAAW family protein [Streptomyces sp. NPDC005423]|uniref:HGxxPAAW family protein n=1 Tax=Streptomyces sp. NPDC005423 TaxID=3155343 RepID=UPI0033AB37B6